MEEKAHPTENGSPRRTRPVRPMSQRARQLRQDATPAESALWEIIRARRCHGWRFVRQAVAGHFVMDFYCPAARLALEIDGSIHDLPAVHQNDKDRQKVLQSDLHITILHFTNDQILNTLPNEISAQINQAAHTAQAQFTQNPDLFRIARHK